MGCDIHMRCEVHKDWKDVWEDADFYYRNPYYKEGEEGEDGEEFIVNPIYSHRNYTMFSVLAGVRNYVNNEPISEPRGIPTDCNEHIRADVEYWWIDGHSHSYFTLRELVDYVKLHEHSDILNKGGLTKEVWEYEEKELRRELDEIIEEMKKRILWSSLKKEENFDRIRIVFWFDN